MIDPKLLLMLRCPIDGSKLELADDSVVDRLNQAIDRGEVRNVHDQKVSEPIEGGLLCESAGRLYPIRGGIPSLVADEAIEVPR